ncbi:hypothetical protein SLA2020_158950 [Shorea laevis]
MYVTCSVKNNLSAIGKNSPRFQSLMNSKLKSSPPSPYKASYWIQIHGSLPNIWVYDSTMLKPSCSPEDMLLLVLMMVKQLKGRTLMMMLMVLILRLLLMVKGNRKGEKVPIFMLCTFKSTALHSVTGLPSA